VSRARFGHGWIKSDRTAEPHLNLLHRARAKRALPPLSAPDLTHFRGHPLEQGQVGACWAFALTRAVQLWLAANEAQPDVEISERFAYYVGRREEFAGKDPATLPPLEDTGTDPIIGMEGVQHVGIVEASECPYVDSVEVNNEQPSLTTFVDAYDFRDLAWAQVFEPGTARADAVAELLRERIPVIFGCMVDVAFEDNLGQRITAIDPVRILGGHMIAVLAVLDADVIAALGLAHAKPGDILFDNWWGQSWGANGLGIMSPECFGGQFVDDVLSLTAVPLGRRVGE